MQNRTKGFNSLGQSADEDKQARRPEAEHAIEEGKLDLSDGGGVLQQEVAGHHPTSKMVNSSASWSTYQPGGHLISKVVNFLASWSSCQQGGQLISQGAWETKAFHLILGKGLVSQPAKQEGS